MILPTDLTPLDRNSSKEKRSEASLAQGLVREYCSYISLLRPSKGVYVPNEITIPPQAPGHHMPIVAQGSRGVQRRRHL